jgi:hypothetical protein
MSALIDALSRQASWKLRALSKQWRGFGHPGSKKNAVVHVAQEAQLLKTCDKQCGSQLLTESGLWTESRLLNPVRPATKLFWADPPSQSLANLSCPAELRFQAGDSTLRAYLQERSPTIWI